MGFFTARREGIDGFQWHGKESIGLDSKVLELLEQEWLSEADDEQIQRSAADEMGRAVKFAEDSPWPEPDQVGTDVLLDTMEVA